MFTHTHTHIEKERERERERKREIKREDLEEGSLDIEPSGARMFVEVAVRHAMVSTQDDNRLPLLSRKNKNFFLKKRLRKNSRLPLLSRKRKEKTIKKKRLRKKTVVSLFCREEKRKRKKKLRHDGSRETKEERM